MEDVIFGFVLVGITMALFLWLWYAVSSMSIPDDHCLIDEDYADIKELAKSVHRSKAK